MGYARSEGGIEGRLPPGTKCQYWSASYSTKWPARVQQYHADDGTYSLDIRQHAAVENIFPDPQASAGEAWPPGTHVQYQSNSFNQLVPAKVLSYNEPADGREGTYNLDIRQCAQVDRIR